MAHLLRLPGPNAITRPAVEPLPHIDALLDGTLGSRFFTKLDLASSYHQLSVRGPVEDELSVPAGPASQYFLQRTV